jgi:YD repeat-containing protein
LHKYDTVGNLTNVVYNTSPQLKFQYDVFNRLTNMIDAAGTNRYTYWPGGQLYTDDGPWTTDTLTYSYNDARLPSGFTLQLVGGGTWTQSYTYDAAHRLEEVTSQAGTFQYSYDNGQTVLPGRCAFRSIRTPIPKIIGH